MIRVTENVTKAETKKDQLQLETEFDEMLVPIKRKVFVTIGVLVATVIPFEIVLIFGFLSDSGRVALQTLHGALVGLGALVIFAVSMLLVLLPTKLMSYKAYKMSKAAADSAESMMETVQDTAASVKEFITEGRETFKEMRNAAQGTKLEELTVRFELKMDQTGKRLESALQEHFGRNDAPRFDLLDEVDRPAKKEKT